ncbi:MAG: hypothetical protein OER77_12710, partial [Myxococcales bacterium]|nr:hypothetical protein [Myxococcales bacterium]
MRDIERWLRRHPELWELQKRGGMPQRHLYVYTRDLLIAGNRVRAAKRWLWRHPQLRWVPERPNVCDRRDLRRR